MSIIPYSEADKWLKDNRAIYQMALSQVPGRALKLKEAKAWLEAMSRCYNPDDPRFLMFGGRSIHMDDEWHLFAVFLADLGFAPPNTTGLGRYNLDAGYVNGNAYWLSEEEQLQLPKE